MKIGQDVISKPVASELFSVKRENFVDYSNHPIVLRAFDRIRNVLRVKEITIPKVVMQTPSMKLIHKFYGDISEYKVHGYEKARDMIIVPSEPELSSVIHEYGHYIFAHNPQIARVPIPTTVYHPDGSFSPVWYSDDPDEFFAYNFGIYIYHGHLKDEHPDIRKTFMKMLKLTPLYTKKN